MRVLTVSSPEETFALGEQEGRIAKAGAIYALDGDLGAGKTVWIRGFAAGLGVSEDVTSPTFTIVQEYWTGRLPMFHFDVYRIDDPEELYEIGFDEYLFGNGVTLIEWASKAVDFLPEDVIRIRIERLDGEGPDRRRITYEDPREEEGK